MLFEGKPSAVLGGFGLGDGGLRDLGSFTHGCWIFRLGV